MVQERRKGGPGRVTQRDIARHASASQAAVSRVLMKKGYVADDVKKRIEEAILTLGYRPDPAARSLISGRSNIIAIVMANVLNPFFPVALDALTGALRKRGRDVLLFNAAAGQKIDELIPEVLRYRVAGIIVTTADLTSRAAEICNEAGVPVVLFHRYAEAGNAPIVACDNARGGSDAANLLLDAGCHKLAYLGGNSGSSPNRDRRAGWLEALAARGLAPVATMDGSFTYDWGAEGVARLIQEGCDFDAIFCGDDAIACGAIDALRYKFGLRVPEDVSLVGFDDVPQASWEAYRLSTIRQPVPEMVEATLQLLETEDLTPAKILVPSQVIRRATVRS